MVKYRNVAGVIISICLISTHGWVAFYIVSWAQQNVDNRIMLFMVVLLGMVTISIALALVIAVMQSVWHVIIRILYKALAESIQRKKRP